VLFPIRLYRIIVPVTDIERATVFYSTLTGQAGERVSPGRHYFDASGVVMACYDPKADGDDMGEGWKHHPNHFLYFAVFDLDACLELFVAAGGTVSQEIDVMPWGERLFYGTDPFGNPICFVDEMTLFTGGST
jgi:predicted enzyme related to lactoylglutathione lyase